MELGKGAEGHRSIHRRGWGLPGAQRSCKLGWPRASLTPGSSFPSGAGGVRSACLSIPTASTPASISATNYRHLSPGIWLRALTGESLGPLGEGERRVLPDPWSSCFLHINDAGVLVFNPSFCPVPSHLRSQMGPRVLAASSDVAKHHHEPRLGLSSCGSAWEELTGMQCISQVLGVL